IKFESLDEELLEMILPLHFEVCDVCEGKGTHVSPLIDCDGLTAEDFAEDPDFREEYLEGKYDVTCNTCVGERVLPQVNEDKLNPEQKAFWDKYQKHCEARAESEAISRKERM